MKIAIISDTHIGAKTDSFANAGAEEFLKRFTSELVLPHRPDVVAHLGDHIQHSDDGSDSATFARVLSHFDKLKCPVLDVVGNHDQANLSEEALCKLLKRKSLYYSVDVAGYHFIVLFSKTKDAAAFAPAPMSDKQLLWLEKDLASTSLPTIVISHHSLAAHDFKGNVWFEGRPECALIPNRQAVLDILEKSKKVRAIFNGHLHRNGFVVEGTIPAFAMQSVVEIHNVPIAGTAAFAWGVFEIDEHGARLEVYGRDPVSFSHRYV